MLELTDMVVQLPDTNQEKVAKLFDEISKYQRFLPVQILSLPGERKPVIYVTYTTNTSDPVISPNAKLE
ncbi:MAG: hypothetical protein FOGNACKC_02222 [Anaerolineae bacterium]|nr:hypothetical protein [Anaerolineae bacterium]